jgi:uncharacterized protein
MRHSVMLSAMGVLCLFATTAPAATVPANTQIAQIVRAASEQTLYTRFYDPAYVKLAYPGGGPPLDRGVCSDVIVRAFRLAGVDLQKEVHEDMARNFAAYPNRWHATGPDPNIDHRRVPNLMTYFTRKGASLPIRPDATDYAPGDVVAWDLGGGLLHVGLVSDERALDSGRYEIVHNIGAGARREDVLFSWRVIGHYRYFKPEARVSAP